MADSPVFWCNAYSANIPVSDCHARRRKLQRVGSRRADELHPLCQNCPQAPRVDAGHVHTVTMDEFLAGIRPKKGMADHAPFTPDPLIAKQV